MNRQLLKVHWKIQLPSPFLWLMAVIVFADNLQAGLEHWKNGIFNEPLLQAGTIDWPTYWSLWSGSFLGTMVILFWGLWIFYHVDRPRRNGLSKLLYTKPLPYFTEVKHQLVTLVGSGALMYLTGMYASNIVVALITDQWTTLLWFLLPPLISGTVAIAFYTLVFYALSLLSTDWLVFAPINFITGIFTGVFVDIFLNYRKLTNVLTPWLDPYLYLNRLLLFCAGAILLLIIRHIVVRQERGQALWGLRGLRASQTNGSSGSNTNLQLLTAPLARARYSLKVYYGWRLVVGVLCGLSLGLLYAWRMWTKGLQYDFVILMTGQSVLSLLGILTSLHLAEIEQQFKMLTTIKTLPRGGVQAFRDKLFAMVAYFLLLLMSFSIPFLLVGQLRSWPNYALAIFPPFLFFIGIGYLCIHLTRRTFAGYLVSGGLWFLMISLEKNVPYWLQPFFEIAEYRFRNIQPYFVNKLTISGIALVCFCAVIWLEYRRLNSQTSVHS